MKDKQNKTEGLLKIYLLRKYIEMYRRDKRIHRRTLNFLVPMEREVLQHRERSLNSLKECFESALTA